jgi:aryl-alcohol dehydrogenase-like predicted oxidoreductase
LAQPGVSSVIAGATTPEQIEANAAAADAWTPTTDDLAEIDRFFPLPEDPAARV